MASCTQAKRARSRVGAPGHLHPIGPDAEGAQEQVLAHPEAVEHDDEEALPVEAAPHGPGQALGGGGDEAARDGGMAAAGRPG